MNCPYCGNEMEQGVIQNQYEINWKRKRCLLGKAEFHEGSVVLSRGSMLKGSAVIAFLCRNCEKIIIDYKDGSCELNRK